MCVCVRVRVSLVLRHGMEALGAPQEPTAPSRGAISRTRVGGKVDIITGTRHGGTGWQFGCNPVQALVLVLLRGLCNTIFFLG